MLFDATCKPQLLAKEKAPRNESVRLLRQASASNEFSLFSTNGKAATVLFVTLGDADADNLAALPPTACIEIPPAVIQAAIAGQKRNGMPCIAIGPRTLTAGIPGWPLTVTDKEGLVTTYHGAEGDAVYFPRFIRESMVCPDAPLTVTLDAALLHKVAQSMGTDLLRVSIDARGVRTPLFIDAMDDHGHGVVPTVGRGFASMMAIGDGDKNAVGNVDAMLGMLDTLDDFELPALLRRVKARAEQAEARREVARG
jgi:hypothetical protein